ncbi:acyl-CoA thioester hydrolase [Propionibacterium cyclohexanicum]|uniref:Acyl-CoA thioester hydrolase n=1 Tax=Propionibacterium cyclohexanicum TaxID=64702 RepID=A0A1H9SCA0_9ACTN|nr:thioesterase family protein [Propionibacterium cyclohexanicum]SER82666.1 acyl-CoA thioester hydrolase [Propionibacterium cyclohexanicum]
MPAFHALVPLRWSDLDAQGHINNVSVLDFTQEARALFMAKSPEPALLVNGSVLVNQQVEFLRPLRLSEQPIDVGLGATGIGAARFSMDYELRQDDELCARVSTLMCPFDFERQRVRVLQPAERECLRQVSVPPGSWPALPTFSLSGWGEPTPLRARWSDQDRYGHVNNVRILDWVQEARIEATARIDPGMARAGQQGRSAGDHHDMWVVARQDVQYLHQLSWREEPYLALTAPLRVGRSSVTLGCEISDPRDSSVRVRCCTVLVHLDEQGRPCPLPVSTRTAMAGRLAA